MIREVKYYKLKEPKEFSDGFVVDIDDTLTCKGEHNELIMLSIVDSFGCKRIFVANADELIFVNSKIEECGILKYKKEKKEMNVKWIK